MVTAECKMSENLSSECFNIGRDIDRSRQDQNRHRRAIADCEREIRNGTERIREVRRQLNVLRSTQVAIETTPRVLGPGPMAAGMITSEGIGLARQIDDLERQRERVSNTVSACTRRLNTGRGDLSHVESHLERLASEFTRLGCSGNHSPTLNTCICPCEPWWAEVMS